MYQALYRKYRPQTFDEVVGQKNVTQTLKAQLVSGKLSHAYLFTGSRGTGKTSCAKILAKAVNCLNPVDGNPCNCCAACRSIDAGSCMDVLEIDAASNNGVDHVRSLRDDAVFTPVDMVKRVYIIDEVHMLSISAFNALLKIIEEPPEHLLFILATTELHKVPATILSRCQRFSFRRLLPQDIAGRITQVAGWEDIPITPEAVALLSRLADGALRDGMSLLDQCAASAGGQELTPEKIYTCLGLAGARQTALLMRAIGEKDAQKALTIFGQQYSAGKDVAAMLDELTTLCRDLLLLLIAPKWSAGMLSGICTEEEIGSLLPLFTPQELLRQLTLLQDTAANFRNGGNRRLAGELCLMQMCNPALSPDLPAISARLSKLEAMAAGGGISAKAEAQTAPVSSKQANRPPDLPWEEDEETPPPPGEEDMPSSLSPVPEAPPQREAPVGFWADLLAQAKPAMLPSVSGFFSTMENALLQGEMQGDTLVITAQNDWIIGQVDKPSVRALLQDKAGAMLGRAVTVKFTTHKANSSDKDPMQSLLEFGKTHGDIMNIQGE